jgi:hypothetical protein
MMIVAMVGCCPPWKTLKTFQGATQIYADKRTWPAAAVLKQLRAAA